MNLGWRGVSDLNFGEVVLLENFGEQFCQVENIYLFNQTTFFYQNSGIEKFIDRFIFSKAQLSLVEIWQ